jgi:hypothetical protein
VTKGELGCFSGIFMAFSGLIEKILFRGFSRMHADFSISAKPEGFISDVLPVLVLSVS